MRPRRYPGAEGGSVHMSLGRLQESPGQSKTWGCRQGVEGGLTKGAGRSGASHNGVCGVIGGSVALPDAAHILQHLCCRLVLDGSPPLHCHKVSSLPSADSCHLSPSLPRNISHSRACLNVYLNWSAWAASRVWHAVRHRRCTNGMRVCRLRVHEAPLFWRTWVVPGSSRDLTMLRSIGFSPFMWKYARNPASCMQCS